MKQTIAVGAATLGAVIILSGCGLTGKDIVEKSVETQTGGKVDINSDQGKMDIKSSEGDFSMSGTGTATLSPDFPKDIYLAPDARILFSMANGSNKSYSVAYLTDMKVEDVYAKYKEDLTAKGWAADNKTEITIGNSRTIVYKKGTGRLTVMVGVSEDKEANGKTSVQVIGADDSAPSGEPTL